MGPAVKRWGAGSNPARVNLRNINLCRSSNWLGQRTVNPLILVQIQDDTPFSGSSAAAARLFWEQEIAGSIPASSIFWVVGREA